MKHNTNGCFKEYGSKKECTGCKVKNSCKKALGKIIKDNTKWDYRKYHSVLDKKSKLEDENISLFGERLKHQREIMKIGKQMAQNEREIFELNNNGRRIMGHGILKSKEELEKASDELQ